MKLTGKIKVIGETAEFGASAFKKRELVITTNEQFSQDILIEFVQNQTFVLDGFEVGQDVEVSINIKGREWTNPQGEVKYFNSIQGWRINPVGNPTNSAVENYKAKTAPPPPVNNEFEDDGSLPF